jgi:hypothetical protein
MEFLGEMTPTTLPVIGQQWPMPSIQMEGKYNHGQINGHLLWQAEKNIP